MVSDFDLGTTLRQVQRLGPQMARLTRATRDRAIRTMAKRLVDQFDRLLEANTLDLERARDQSASDWLIECMKLTPERLQYSADHLHALANWPDPIGAPDQHWRSDEGVLHSRFRIPLGLIAIVYEIYPEYAISGISMAVKSGNGIVLSCSQELKQTHEALISLLSEAAYSGGLPEGSIQSIPDIESLGEAESTRPHPLLQQSRYLDLVIPCGRPNWVETVAQSSSAPVLLTRLGHGHVFIDASASWSQVQSILLKSLGNYDPESIPVIQSEILWILIHTQWAETHLGSLITELTHRGFALQVDAQIREQFSQFPPISDVLDSTEQPHLRLQQVDSLSAVINWINKYGHHQSEAILSDSDTSIRRFTQDVDAATIHVNSSPLPPVKRPGAPVFNTHMGISIGTSVQRLHARGPLTLESLTTFKYVATGTWRPTGSEKR